MAEQVYWEDIDEGSEVPPLVKEPDSLQLVKYAGASLDFYQIHYDKDLPSATTCRASSYTARLRAPGLPSS